MGVPVLAPSLVERIQSAPPGTTDRGLARDLGIHYNTVRKYRLKARHDREEAAREIIAEHVETNVSDALADLTDLRRLAREKYEDDGDPRQGNLWLAAVKTTLDYVKPDDREFDAAIERELAELGHGRQGPVPEPSAGAAAVH